MKKRLFIIIITLIAFCPFMGGLNGCAQGQIPFGGGIEVPEEKIEAPMEAEAPEVIEEEVVVEEEVPEGSGPEDLLKPEPEEPEKPKDEPETPPPPGVGYLPSDADIYVAQDNRMIQAQDTKDSIEQIGYTDNLQALSQQSAKLLSLAEKQIPIDKTAQEIPIDLTATQIPIDKIVSVSAACFLSEDKKKSDMTNLSLLNCDKFIFVNVFKEDFQMSNLLAGMSEDDKGYIINAKIRAFKPAEKVLIVGSTELIQAPYKGTISDADINALSWASPSFIIVKGKASVIRKFRHDRLIGLFGPMYKMLKLGFDYNLLSAIEFGGKRVKMSTVMKASDGETVEKNYMEFSYGEYAAAKKEAEDSLSNVEPTATSESLSPVRTENSTTLEPAQPEQDSSMLKGTDAEQDSAIRELRQKSTLELRKVE